jgi:hypothetical protein
MTPWNKGKYGYLSPEARKNISKTQKSREHSPSERKMRSEAIKKYWNSKRSLNHYFFKGENHPNWLGDRASYRNCHAWVRRNYIKTGICEHCLLKKKRTEWANKDHTYHRVREDWFELCRSCHLKYDRRKQ